MKKIFYLLIIVAASISFSACKNDDQTNEVWKTANINAYNAITKKPEYHALKTSTGPEGVYYKVIKSGSGTEFPLQTSKVKVLFKGTYYDGTVFDAGSSGNDIPITLLLTPLSTTVSSSSFTNNNISRGLSFAIQNMVVGDKREIWIPYYLGYGAGGRIDNFTGLTMKGYTTLVYEAELVSITMYP
jgi:peptidylprolyl isomerase/FKBP-type peptidyl-prolyl cis-trans isomerase FklB